MNLYAIKFREKGEREYRTVLIMATGHADLKTKWDDMLADQDNPYDVDLRTVSWAGGSVPLSNGQPVVLYTNLDGCV